jgi:hypothetical protein
MPIKKNNLKLINELENRLKDQLTWQARDGLKQHTDAIDRLRNFKQFIMAISTSIVAILFPLILLEKDKFTNTDFFIISLVLLSYVILYGVLQLVMPTLREVIELPVVSQYHNKRLLKMIKEVQAIKKVEDNDTAGKKCEAIKSQYSQMPPEQEINWLKKYWNKYESLIYC